MRFSLEKLVKVAKTGIRTLTATAIISLPLFSQPAFSTEKPKSATYSYFTQARDIRNTGLNKTTKGLLYKMENGITSEDTYPPPTTFPRYPINIDISIKESRNGISFSYNNSQKLAEDLPDTHIYLVLPNEVKPIGYLQKIYTISRKTGEAKTLRACSPDDTKLSQILKIANMVMEKTYMPTEKEEENITEMERMYNNLSEMVGGNMGKAMKKTKSVVKKVMTWDEKRRRAKLQKKYGDEYSIWEIPSFVADGLGLQYTCTGRENITLLDTSKLRSAEEAFIEAKRITFRDYNNGNERLASLEDLVSKMKILPAKGKETDIYIERRKHVETETENFLKPEFLGEWEMLPERPLSNEKKYTMVFFKNMLIEKLDGKVKRSDKIENVISNETQGWYDVIFANAHDIFFTTIAPNIMATTVPGVQTCEHIIIKRPDIHETPESIEKIQGDWQKIRMGYSTNETKIKGNKLMSYFQEGISPPYILEAKIKSLSKLENLYIIRFRGPALGKSENNPCRWSVQYFRIKNNHMKYMEGETLSSITAKESVIGKSRSPRKLPPHGLTIKQNPEIEFYILREKPSPNSTRAIVNNATNKLLFEDKTSPILTNKDVKFITIEKGKIDLKLTNKRLKEINRSTLKDRDSALVANHIGYLLIRKNPHAFLKPNNEEGKEIIGLTVPCKTLEQEKEILENLTGRVVHIK